VDNQKVAEAFRYFEQCHQVIEELIRDELRVKLGPANAALKAAAEEVLSTLTALETPRAELEACEKELADVSSLLVQAQQNLNAADRQTRFDARNWVPIYAEDKETLETKRAGLVEAVQAAEQKHTEANVHFENAQTELSVIEISIDNPVFGIGKTTAAYQMRLALGCTLMVIDGGKNSMNHEYDVTLEYVKRLVDRAEARAPEMTLADWDQIRNNASPEFIPNAVSAIQIEQSGLNYRYGKKDVVDSSKVDYTHAYPRTNHELKIDPGYLRVPGR
jgi:hypothetical protein